jgi:hypothetical protein
VRFHLLSCSSFCHNLTSFRLPLYEITAEVWSLDKFYGSFTTLRSQVLARNVQRRMSPVARLCGNLALLGDPVVLWNWKRKGPFFTMSSGNIHQSPTVNTSIWILCGNFTETIPTLARQCSGGSSRSGSLTSRPSVAHPIITDPAIRSVWSTGPGCQHLRGLPACSRSGKRGSCYCTRNDRRGTGGLAIQSSHHSDASYNRREPHHPEIRSPSQTGYLA